LAALTDPRGKAAGGDQRRTSRMTTTSISLLIEDDTRIHRTAHLALGSFRLKLQLTSRATCEKKKRQSDRNKDR
jgi:hypothetical protein